MAAHPMAPVPDALFGESTAEARWRSRFDAVRIGLPEPARDAPDRAVFVSNQSGTYELHTWDLTSGAQQQATSRSDGTTYGTLSPDGDWLWWFDDEAGDEFGVWRRQPFDGSTAAAEALPGVAAGYPSGLEVGRSVVLAGFADDDGTRIHLSANAAPADVVYRNAEDAHAGPLSRDETLWVLAHSEAGDYRYRELRVLRVADGSVVAELSDLPGKSLTPVSFAPTPGDQRLLVGHERRGREELLIWDVASGAVSELLIDLPGDLDADFTPDGTALLVLHTHAGRTTVHRYDLTSGVLTDLPTARGSVSGAVARADGSVWYRHTSASQAGTVRVLADDVDEVLVVPPGGVAPGSQRLADLWVDGPGGRIHAFLATPPDAVGPLATVIYVHGGPADADDDSYDATRATWLDAGFAVAQVNYRGSTGYGSAWRDALTERLGHTELADITAVHDHLIAAGVTDPTRSVLLGYSWGGFLTLLGIGSDPHRWAVAVAGAPVADYVAAYEDEMEPLRAYDRALFGGSPAEVPEKYTDSSPLTYLADVRTPVLVSAGENDPRTPIRQIENYLDGLAAQSKDYEVYRYDAGHGSMVVAERIRQVAVEVDFVRRMLARRG